MAASLRPRSDMRRASRHPLTLIMIELLLAGVLAAALLVLVSGRGGAGGAGAGPRGSHADLYVALGDSLSVGIQVINGVQPETRAGYTDDVAAFLRRRDPRLGLVELGCPGDTSTSLLDGDANRSVAAVYHCDRAGGSQLAAALALIRARRAHVRLVTIDIGFNDAVACLVPAVTNRGPAAIRACLHGVEVTLARNLRRILSALHRAVAPGTPLVGVPVYDPFITGLLDPNPAHRAVARATLRVVDTINAELTRADAAAGFATAEVPRAFAVHDETPTYLASLRRPVPRNVAIVCADTYMCSATPNVHANAAGYQRMAAAVEARLPGPAEPGH